MCLINRGVIADVPLSTAFLGYCGCAPFNRFCAGTSTAPEDLAKGAEAEPLGSTEMLTSDPVTGSWPLRGWQATCTEDLSKVQVPVRPLRTLRRGQRQREPLGSTEQTLTSAFLGWLHR